MERQLKHLDEAREGAVVAMLEILDKEPEVFAAVIVDDLFGRISVTLWLRDLSAATHVTSKVNTRLEVACAQYWTGNLAISDTIDPSAEEDILRRTAWQEGVSISDQGRLRLNDRYRNRTGWFVGADSNEQLWPLEQGPPVIAFHGFKGGAGRTTLLASYALACTRRGERVAVIDVDLDAPGVGLLLDANANGEIARWGIADYLLEAGQNLPLSDYFHVCAREKVTGAGQIEVFPAGSLDDTYLSKLGRIDLDVRGHMRGHPLGRLLQAIASERKPDVVLLDGRAGLSPAAGLLLSGIAHLHVLVATTNMQTLQGLERIVRHLGFEQARRELPQRECVVVQAHVPDSNEAALNARDYFAARVEEIFREGYYTRQPSEDDRTWSLGDLDSEIAPHVPIPISYRGRLAHFRVIDEVADLLVSDPEYVAFHRRLDERMSRSEYTLTAVDAHEEDGDG